TRYSRSSVLSRSPFFAWRSCSYLLFFFFSSRRRHTRWPRDWSSDVCSSDLLAAGRVHDGDLPPRADHLLDLLEGHVAAFLRVVELAIGVPLDHVRHVRASLTPRVNAHKKRRCGDGARLTSAFSLGGGCSAMRLK